VNQLVRLVDRYSNNELFERNVRLFLGVKKEVNKRIIETITSNQAVWFGFMNNGVSSPRSCRSEPASLRKKLRVMVDNMQIINGCQTVNALYHAKYDAALKTSFQGNSNVLLRIYHIDPANQPFMEALIIATNSQNAIRAEAWLPMIHRKRNWRRNSARRPWHTNAKRAAAMAASFGLLQRKNPPPWPSSLSSGRFLLPGLRNSASRREIFRKGDEYLEIFSGATTNQKATRYPAETIKQRTVQMLAAAQIEQAVREMIADSEGDRQTTRCIAQSGLLPGESRLSAKPSGDRSGD